MNNIIKILKKELIEVFRDKKSLAMMLIVPILIPLIVIGMSALFNGEVNKPITEYNKIGFNYKLSQAEKDLAKKMNIVVYEYDDEQIKEAYDNASIDLYITKENNNYTIIGYDNETTSYATSLMKEYYSNYKEMLQKEYLMNNNINYDEVINIINVNEDIIPQKNYYANYMVNYAFLFIIMAITISATYPATDATAGEKERGTLETLLTFPIKSRDIIIGKFLSVSLSSIITGFLGLALTQLSFYISNDKFDIYKDVNLMLSFKELIFSGIIIITFSFLISGLCIAIASKSKTFKEAQSALTPITFIAFVPSMIVSMINMKTDCLLAIIPFLNQSLIFRDMTNDYYNMLHIGLMILSSFVFIGLVLNLIIKQYKSEKVLFTE